MDRVLPGKSLPKTDSLSNRGFPQGHYGTMVGSYPGTVCDVRIRKFQKKDQPCC